MVAFFCVPLTLIKVTVLPLAKRDFNSMKNMHFDNELLMKSTALSILHFGYAKGENMPQTYGLLFIAGEKKTPHS